LSQAKEEEKEVMHTTEKFDKFYYLFPQTVAMIGVGRNLMPAAWHTPMSAAPPLYGTLVSPKRYTYELLTKENGFTVNFLKKDQAHLIAQLGSTSGRDIDKLDRFNIRATVGQAVNGVIMDLSYAAYECEKYAMHEYGDHFLVVGRIVLTHLAQDTLLEKNLVDEKKVFPALYFGKDRYLTTDPNSLSIHKKE
jgi:flavin reductase (DIM6/NTAB) family NADH-FMN oxidoreductase RutF